MANNPATAARSEKAKIAAWLQLQFPRLLLLLALVVLSLQYLQAAWLFGEHAVKAVGFPYALDYGEGPLLDQVRRLAHFEDIYQTRVSSPPYTITNYPPLYPLAQVPFYWIFGPKFWYGRLISLAGVLASALFIGLTLHHISRSRLAGFVGGLALPAFPFVLHWSPLARVDSLALGLSWAGLYVIVRWGRHPRGLFAGAVLLVAAIFTRQSYGLAAPLAAFVWLAHRPPRVRALRLALWLLLLGSGLFLALNLVTRGGFFFHIVTANVNPFEWQTVSRYAADLRANLPYLLAGGAVLLLSFLWDKPQTWWLAAPYLLASVATAITIGKDGSNVNYLYELSAALSLSTGALIAWMGKRRWLTALLLLLLLPQLHGLLDWSKQDFYGRNMGKLRYEVDLAQMETMVQAAEGAVLADEYMGHLPLAGKPIVYQPFEFKMLAEAGLWDQRPFIQAIEQQRYSLILLYEPRYWDSRGERWTPEMLNAIESAYRRNYRIAETAVYTPRKQIPN